MHDCKLLAKAEPTGVGGGVEGGQDIYIYTWILRIDFKEAFLLSLSPLLPPNDYFCSTIW